MSKYIITNNNTFYDSTYANVPYFANEEDRDNFVETNLLSDWKNKLNNRPELGNKIDTNLTDTIQIQDNFNNIMNKNYMIIEKNNKYYFYFITKIDNINNKTFLLTIEKDIIMTYPAILNKVKNVKLTQSHLKDYYGYNFDGGYKEVSNISDFPYKDNDNEVYNQIKNKGWLVVFERVNNKDEYINKIHNGNEFKEPYKIYIAPLTPFQVKENLADETILYEQSSPTEYNVVGTYNDKITIQIGLSDTLNLEEDINIFSNAIADDTKTNKTFTIKKEWIPVLENNSRIVVVPYEGDNGIANNINQNITNGTSYNDNLKMNDYNLGTIGSNYERLYYLPLKITKLSNTLYSFETIKVSEWINYIPNAYMEGNIQDDYDRYRYDTLTDNFGLYAGGISNQIAITIYKISQTSQNVWGADNLFSYLEDPDNANIISGKTTNFIAIDTNQNEGIFEIDQTNNLTQNSDEREKGIFRLASINYDNLLKVNTYSLNVSNYSKYDLIEGLNKYGLIIENMKEFSLNPNFITENNTIDIEHYASFTPTWEERIKYVNGKYICLTNEDNAFANNKEFVKGIDILSQYKVNNPFTSKLEWFKPFTSASNLGLFQLTNFRKKTREDKRISTLSQISSKKSFNKYLMDSNEERLNYILKSFEGTGINYKSIISPLVAMLGDFASIGINRANMKRQPDEFQGNGDINGDLIFNANSIKFSLIEYKFISPERDAIINDIKRYGIGTNIYINDLFDSNIKEKSFNFIKVEELDNSNNTELLQLLSIEEYNLLSTILNSGIRIFWDMTRWKDFNSND